MTNIFLSIFGISISIGFIVIILVLLTPFINKRYAAKWKYLIWIFLAVRLLVPFSGVNGQFIRNMLLQTKTQAVPEPDEKYTDTQEDTAIPSRRIIVEIPTQMTTPIAVQSGKNNTGITMLDLVAVVWITGSLTFISVHLISYFHYKRQVVKRGRKIEDVHILSQMFKLKRELQIGTATQVIEYHDAESPMIIGFLKPVLVLPEEEYSSEELFFILKHELVHLKRRDVYFKLLFVMANAVHWFNPLIRIMQREAVIDMELSCDERVTKGTSYATRKAYTETLLSMLHRRCAKRTVLSTQFYGGTKIMKKRFKNILVKYRKKNGIFILICTVVLTISFGTLVGCSIAKEDAEKENPSVQPEMEAVKIDQAPAEDSFSDDNRSENKITITFSKEGEQEQKQAVLVTGYGYSIYLPENEWQPAGPDLWRTAVNEQVQLWITHFDDEGMDSVDRKLEDDGYVTVQDGHKQKQEGDLMYHVELKAFENDIWGIFYAYPIDAEEGWGREIPVIADTFALSVGEDGVKGSSSDGGGGYLGTEDCQEIRNIVDEFAEAYFGGDVDAIQKFLANTYEGKADIYESTGTIRDLTVKGLSDTDEKKIENERTAVSLEFRDSNYEDMFLYVTFVFVRQEDGWKIQSYGVEG